LLGHRPDQRQLVAGKVGVQLGLRLLRVDSDGLGPLSEGEFEVFVGFFGFLQVSLDDVVQNVLVSLDQSLGVTRSVL